MIGCLNKKFWGTLPYEVSPNPASNYCVVRLKTADPMVPEEARSPYKFSDHLIRFVAVGYDLPQTDSVKMELEGTWTNGKHGCQLEVDSWQEVIPQTREGVLNYLSSGLLKGIGPGTARAIVDRFGVNSLDILEHQPERLLEIRGITKERLDEIKAGYAESTRFSFPPYSFFAAGSSPQWLIKK